MTLCKIKAFSRFLFFYAGTERKNSAPSKSDDFIDCRDALWMHNKAGIFLTEKSCVCKMKKTECIHTKTNLLLAIWRSGSLL